MADQTKSEPEDEEDPPKKKGKKGFLIGLLLASLLGGGGFYAVYSGLLFPQSTERGADLDEAPDDLKPVEFVALDPLVISLGRAANNQHLRFRAELEVTPGTAGDVEKLVPRIMDVLNSYLRAVSLQDIEEPTSLINLRAQMLRRIQLVTGDGRVRDLLIMEFVLT